MTASTISSSRPSARARTGQVLSTIAVLFMLFDASGKIARIKQVIDSMGPMGIPVSLSVTIGTLALISTVLYAIPRTAVLGAVLLTGYLGGAIFAQLRIGAGAFPMIFPLIMAVFIWGGLYLRESRLGDLLPVRR